MTSPADTLKRLRAVKATITDGYALGLLKPLDIMAYLREHGWQERDTTHCDIRVWRKDDVEVLVLMTRFRDYAQRMGDTVRTLAEVEGRSQLDVYCDLMGWWDPDKDGS